MKKMNKDYKLVYKTNERKDYIEENCHWYEFRLKGDIIYKYRCQKQKILGKDKNIWTIKESIEETWVADSPLLPDFLKKKIKSSKDPEINRFSQMRTIENPEGYVSKGFFKSHKKAIIIGGSVTAATIIGIILLYKNPQALSKIKDLDVLIKKPSPKEVETIIEITANHSNLPAADVLTATRSIPTEPFHVNAFVRNLPKGQHASEMAIQNATNAGITLEEGQTFVTEFIKYLCSAA